MPKLVKLNGTELGGDIEEVDIYHTSITPSNLISSSVNANDFSSSGVSFVVEDTVTTFLAFVSGGLCFGTSGSVTASVYSPNTRYFEFSISGSNIDTATIEMISPTAVAPTQNTFTASVNFLDYSSATVRANEDTYPNDQFVGWYYKNTSTQISSNSTLTLTLNTFTGSDDIVAFFKDN